ncbi:MAG: hypothetical protein DMG37_08085 [Acidobacteria bacterium]|nr:MAG: hypothetical protein DMG37_08085 [Acidobacteriota bacterium]
MAQRLQFYKLWGRRAEDPFRGLRAGPVRFSPILSLMVSRLAFPETHQATPEVTPGNKKVGESMGASPRALIISGIREQQEYFRSKKNQA